MSVSPNGMEENYKVVIVGGGTAGMCAAYYLNDVGVKDVVILEANDYLGGRTKSTNFFKDKKIEIGAELLHGDGTLLNTLVSDMINDPNSDMEDKNGLKHENVFNLGKENGNFVLYHHKTSNIYTILDEKIAEMNKQLGHALEYKGEQDISLRDYFIQEKQKTKNSLIDDEMLDLLDSFISKTAGTNIYDHGLKGKIEEDHRYGSNDENYAFVGSYSDALVKKLTKDIPPSNLRLNSPVKMIIKSEKHKGKIKVVYGDQYRTIICEKLILTVPISMIKEQDENIDKAVIEEQIIFQPSLPESKYNALKSLKMTPGMKVFAQFSENFLKSQFKSAQNLNLVFVGGHEYIPQFWFPIMDPNCPKFIITGFSVGDTAGAWSKSGKSEEELIQSFVQLLDSFVKALIKKEQQQQSSSSALPTSYKLPSELFECGLVKDWTSTPYIRGSYSSCGLDAVHARDVLSAPCWDDSLFFAGEATFIECCSTVSGSLESGRRAAREVCRSLTITSKL